jgi:DNA-directed RNA polymerase subunit RPC12/RpoP
MNHYGATCNACGAKMLVKGDNPTAVAAFDSKEWRALPVTAQAFMCAACDTYN